MPKTCSVDGCKNVFYCKGFCANHYHQYKKHGHVLPELPPCISLPGEEWKDVVGWEGIYQVSNMGRVKALNYGRRQAPQPRQLRTGKNGYSIVDLANKQIKKTVGVHRLVCEAFIPNPENKSDVNHRNGVKHDNRLENLEWATRSENMAHCKNVLRKNAGRNPTPVICVETGEIYPNMHAAGLAVGRTPANIKMAVDGKYKTTAGYHWSRI